MAISSRVTPMIQLISRGRAESAGEEYAAHVERDGGQEDQGGPVVGLAHDQPGPDVEGDVDDATA